MAKMVKTTDGGRIRQRATIKESTKIDFTDMVSEDGDWELRYSDKVERFTLTKCGNFVVSGVNSKDCLQRASEKGVLWKA